jgi:hypothetical protein
MEVFKKRWYLLIVALVFALIASPIIFNTYTPFGACQDIFSTESIVTCNLNNFFPVLIAPIYALANIPSQNDSFRLLWLVGVIWCIAYLGIFLSIFFGSFLILYLFPLKIFSQKKVLRKK